MRLPLRIARFVVRRTRAAVHSTLLAFPKNVQCNVCGWQGRRFLSDAWHRHINCPKCRSGIRQRLFCAALQHSKDFSFSAILDGKSVLQFAPEPGLGPRIREHAQRYATADFLREDCDFKLDMCNMHQIGNGSFDVVIAFDVLEHVPDYLRALEEVRRVLSPTGLAIFTVPQKDGLPTIFEDPSIVTAEDRKTHYGEGDHLRIFGSDFPQVVGSRGFDVAVVDETNFPEELRRKLVLFPPELSTHPLATNYRRVFFCRKTT